MKQTTYTLTHLDNFLVADDKGNVYFGCDQDWFGSNWQRLSGCGPTVAATILLYMYRTKATPLPVDVKNKTECTALMESVWRYVTPTARGIYLLDQLCKGVQRFAQENGYALDCFSLNIPEKAEERPDLSTVIQFISEGLIHDCPVAFLNLSNGEVSNLDEWHWVTIVSLQTDQYSNTAKVTISDGTKAISIDLKLWYETTTQGGGFVYFLKGAKAYLADRAG